jgi:trimeric autotransporter adhesin
MSGQSPATVLYSSDGTELTVQNNVVVPTGTRAILISGVTPSGASAYMPATVDGILGVAQMSNHQTVQSAATVTTTGSFTTSSYFNGAQEVALVVNVGTVTGAGSIQYTVQEVDSLGTVYGNSATTSVITSGNAPGIFTAVLNVTTSRDVKVSWTVTGTFSATITANLLSKTTPSTQTINGTVTATNNSVGSDGAAALAFDTQVGGITTTAAPTYTTGNLDALSLTTKGGLRIDGVYPTTTTTANAADAVVSGGYVTTAAPTYTTGQLNALSLTTAGSLRVDGTGGVFNNQSVGSDAAAALTFDTQVGGITTTAAPTYTTGNLDALSLTTKGGLRIDGVYPAATTNANAADVMVAGGYVTTAAPTYTTGQMNPLSIDTAGNLRVSAITNKASTATVTSVAVTANTATSLLAANTSRVFGAIYNNTNKNAFVLLGGGTASAANFTILLITGSYWELPVDWQGAVSEFSPNGASGAILCTELTP